MHSAESIRKKDIVRLPDDKDTSVVGALKAINKNLIVMIDLLINIRSNQATLIKAMPNAKLMRKEDVEGQKK